MDEQFPLVLLLVAFAVPWALGLAPALIARYVWFGEPIPKFNATLIAGITSVVGWIAFRVLESLARQPGEEGRPSTGLVWILVFFVARWLMTRGFSKEEWEVTHPDEQYVPPPDPLTRAEMIEGLQAMLANPETSPEHRIKAIERLRAFGVDVPGPASGM